VSGRVIAVRLRAEGLQVLPKAIVTRTIVVAAISVNREPDDRHPHPRALRNLGHHVGRSTIARIFKARGVGRNGLRTNPQSSAQDSSRPARGGQDARGFRAFLML
jgi:hypothetical protein